MRLSRQDLIANKELAQDKVYGSLAGLAIGDSFGDAGRKEQNHMDYGIITDFTKGDSWSTDDTEFALFTTQMLIETDGELTFEALEQGWLKYIVTQDEFPRGGGSEIEAANNLRNGLKAPFSGMYNAYYMSDGAAMRVAPIGMVYAGDPEKAAYYAGIDAGVSHYRDGVWAAQAVAAAVAVSIADGSDEEVLAAAKAVLPQDSWMHHNFSRMMDLIDRHDGDVLRCWMPLHDEFRSVYKAVVTEAVVQAFGIFRLAKGDFQQGIILAGNFGRDADTIGAIVGALLGARHGASRMPAHWIEKTRYPTGTCLQFTKGLTIKGVAMDLAALIR